MPTYDTLWINAHLATMRRDCGAYGMVRDAALAANGETIAWLGPAADLPGPPEALARNVVDAGGRWITPGFVDPHTHLIFGGDRVADFERRVAGERYASAAGAGAGSGIARTVALTRAASEAELFASAQRRLRTLVAAGATTVEIKSGYGLDLSTELSMLAIAHRLGTAIGISVRTTYLGAHVIPAEYESRRSAYLDLVCNVIIPRIGVERLADAVDVFCDAVAFAPSETARVLRAAAHAGLPVKVHADQIEDTGAAALAASFGALSADHLERTTLAGVRALAASGTVAVLLPGAYYYLQEPVKPPIAALREHGVPLALATDCNPGTSPILAGTTILNMACVLFGFSPEEALTGVTRNGALALGLRDRGELRPGLRCDLALWDVASPAELCYWLGNNPCAGVVSGGIPVRRVPSVTECERL